MHYLEKEISDNLTQQLMLKDNDYCILVGVSGGPDSIALLHILHSLHLELGITLIATYINHGLRPEEAEKEEEFVASVCNKHGITCEIVKVNVREYSKQNKQSLEHAARELRYRALRELKEKHSASLIAVAHTADDQAEEILIRLLRGSGRKGLCGMQNRSGDIIRPLLSVNKQSLLQYLEDKKISFCEDSSNSDMQFLRNRVRHQLIPYLEKEFDRGICSALRKTAESLTEDEKLLEDMTNSALDQVIVNPVEDAENRRPNYRLDRELFKELPSALQRRTLEKLFWQLGCNAKYSHIIQVIQAALKGTTGTEIHLSKGLRVGVQREYLELLYPQGQVPWRGKLYD